MTVINEQNLIEIQNKLNVLKEYVVQQKPENMVYPNAGENIPVNSSVAQMNSAKDRCNDLITTIKSNVAALEFV